MVQVDLTRKQVDLLFAALKEAESGFTSRGLFDVCQNLSVMYDSLRRQVFDFEEVTDADV